MQPIQIWDYVDAPDVLRAQAAANDDIDYLVWAPEEHGDDTVDRVVNALVVCDDIRVFYTEADAQEFLGATHRGGGTLITITHA